MPTGVVLSVLVAAPMRHRVRRKDSGYARAIVKNVEIVAQMPIAHQGDVWKPVPIIILRFHEFKGPGVHLACEQLTQDKTESAIVVPHFQSIGGKAASTARQYRNVHQ